jgi:glutamate--cysteine ligase
MSVEVSELLSDEGDPQERLTDHEEQRSSAMCFDLRRELRRRRDLLGDRERTAVALTHPDERQLWEHTGELVVLRHRELTSAAYEEELFSEERGDPRVPWHVGQDAELQPRDGITKEVGHGRGLGADGYSTRRMGNNPDPRELEPLRSIDELLEPFYAAVKSPAEFRIGAEAEKIGLYSASNRAVRYEGPNSVTEVMRALARSHGWTVTDDSPLLALERAGASVTLEPGAQLELSGAPFADCHAIRAELDQHLEELGEVTRALSSRDASGATLRWYGLGFQPFAAQSDLTWVPKPRYGVMRRYLPARGRYGLDMMRRTATVQANFDYSSEEHAMRALRVGLLSAPFFTAMLANAPFYEGRPFGGRSYRARVWLDVEPSRQGLVPSVLHEGARFLDYVEWALDAPMFLVMRDGAVHENTGQTFRSFMKYGFAGLRATKSDWVTHLNTLFPEVRLKRTLEVRGGDSVPRELVAAPSALYAGLFYDEAALAEAEALVGGFTFDELTMLRREVPELALRAVFRGRPAGEVAQRLLEIADGGLARRARLDDQGRDERRHLQPLVALASQLRCPADLLLARFAATEDVGQALEPALL